MRSLSLKQILHGLLVGAAVLMLIAALNTTVRPGLAQQPTLPPTWTPEPTWTPIAVPTTDTSLNFPTVTLAPPVTPLLLESGDIFAPLFFLSRHNASTVYLARTNPISKTSTPQTTLSDNVLAFDVSSTGLVAYSTDKGVIAAAGRSAWKSASAIASRDPLRPLTLAWSPDNLTLAFALRASDRDFAANSRAEASGVYLWPVSGPPVPIVADKATATSSAKFSVVAWAPNGKYVLLSADETVNGKAGSGWYMYDLSKKALITIIDYPAGSPLVFQNAVWTPDSAQVLLFNKKTDKPDESSLGFLISVGNVRQNLLIKTDGSGNAPQIISAFHFMPDGTVVALAVTRRDQPMQLYTGLFDGASTMTLTPLDEAFKLKFPGILLVTQEGFPVYVIDNQYGVVAFKSGRIFAYYPSQLGMSASTNPDSSYDSDFWPGWKFAPRTATIQMPAIGP